MNQHDFDFIEAKLRVVLPDIFKQFMERFPSEATYQLQYGSAVLPTNAEMFAIAQLHKFPAEPFFDYYQFQPELRLRRFMTIGDEGNGDFYCMVGDDVESDELWAWKHDSAPHPQFVLCTEESFSSKSNKADPNAATSLQTFLQMGWTLSPQPDPFAALPQDRRMICRANHQLRSVFEPITLNEWRNFVAEDPQLEMDEYCDLPDIFSTGKVMRFCRWPGRARWGSGDSTLYLNYNFGGLLVESPDSENLTKEQADVMHGIAQRLNAIVF